MIKVEISETMKGIIITPGNKLFLNSTLNIPVNNPEHNQTTTMPQM